MLAQFWRLFLEQRSSSIDSYQSSSFTQFLNLFKIPIMLVIILIKSIFSSKIIEKQKNDLNTEYPFPLFFHFLHRCQKVLLQNILSPSVGTDDCHELFHPIMLLDLYSMTFEATDFCRHDGFLFFQLSVVYLGSQLYDLLSMECSVV